MRTPVSQNIKAVLIQQWLEGKTRDQIAQENGLGSGTISNIISGWKHNLGYLVAEDLRELAVTLRRVKINAAQCASGARVFSIMKLIGLNEEEFHQFITDIHKQCISEGIGPDKIVGSLKQLLGLSQDMHFSVIPYYLDDLVSRKAVLEQEVLRLEARESDIRKRVEIALQEEGVTSQDLNFRRELWKRQTSEDEIAQFFDVLEGIKQFGFDPATVVSKYHNFLEREMGKIAIEETRKELSKLQEETASHRLMLSEYQQLRSMGYDFKQLKRLADTIKEISDANGIPPYIAVLKFFDDIETQYDKKLGFDLKLDSQKSELKELENRKGILQRQSPDWSWFFNPFGGQSNEVRREGRSERVQSVQRKVVSDSQPRAAPRGTNAVDHDSIVQNALQGSTKGDLMSKKTENNFTAGLTNDKPRNDEAGQPESSNRAKTVQEQLSQNAGEIDTVNRLPMNNFESVIRKRVSDFPISGASSGDLSIYENSTYGVKLRYPSDWFWTEGVGNPINHPLSLQIIVCFNSLNGSLQNPPVANLVLGVIDLRSQNVTLDEFIETYLDDLRHSQSDFRLVSSKSMLLADNNQAKELVYTTAGEKEKVQSEIFTQKRDKVYVIYYEVQSRFPDYLSTLQQMVRSLEFL